MRNTLYILIGLRMIGIGATFDRVKTGVKGMSGRGTHGRCLVAPVERHPGFREGVQMRRFSRATIEL